SFATPSKVVKDSEVMNRLPVIIFSSLITNELFHKGEAVGANAQVSKPDIQELIGLVDKLVL
ncbi:chemotaxis protein CheV, partial [Bacillus thuringiensis]